MRRIARYLVAVVVTLSAAPPTRNSRADPRSRRPRRNEAMNTAGLGPDISCTNGN